MVDAELQWQCKYALDCICPAAFPAIVLSGPRQSGKSTTLRRLFGDTHQYVTFDDPVVREKCLEDPRLFLDNLKSRVILDEIQHVPKILSYIKMFIDEDRQKKGRFIITGSQQFNLIKELGDTLAGRAALLTLLPFNFLEIEALHKTKNAQNIFIRSCLRGSYPEMVVNSSIGPSDWYAGYLQTYLERDVRGLHNVGNLADFQKFVRLLAARCAQAVNLSSFLIFNRPKNKRTYFKRPAGRPIRGSALVLRALQQGRREMGKNLDLLNQRVKGVEVEQGGLICLIKERFPLTRNINALGLIDYLEQL